MQLINIHIIIMYLLNYMDIMLRIAMEIVMKMMCLENLLIAEAYCGYIWCKKARSLFDFSLIVR